MSTLPVPESELDGDEQERAFAEVVGTARRFGRYELCVELAAGGMGAVYLARALGPAGFEKLVALKRIHPHLAREKSFVDMFLDEARIASRISHPNVCQVFDFGEANGTYFIAMEYLFGEPLSRLLAACARREDRGGAQRVALATKIVADACEGLHAAHELRAPDGGPLGVVHRDVSPHNLFVTWDGSVHVVDFGIARARGRLHETTTGTVKGKYAYMAPEQSRGRTVDRRADVWSLGVVLWELATARRLFRRASQTETILAVLEEPIDPPSAFAPDVPRELDAIVLRALSRDPAQRHPTARALARELHDLAGARSTSVGLADIADWMDELLPGGRERSLAVLESARVHATNDGRPSSPGGLTVATLPDRPPRARTFSDAPTTPRGSEPVPGSDDYAVAMTHITPISRPPERAPRGGSRIVIGVGAVAALALAGTLAWSMRHMLDGGAAAQTDVPAPARSATSATARPQPPPAAPSTPTPTAAAVSTPASPTAPVLAATPTPASTPGAARTAHRAPRTPVSRTTAPTVTTNGADSSPERPTPTTTAATGTGTVNVVTQGGWGHVYENGRMLGETPARLALRAGRHVLEVRSYGRAPGRMVTVDVTPGGLERVSVRAE